MLPNGVRDTFDVTTGVHTQRVKEYVLQANDIEALITSLTYVDLVQIQTFYRQRCRGYQS